MSKPSGYVELDSSFLLPHLQKFYQYVIDEIGKEWDKAREEVRLYRALSWTKRLFYTLTYMDEWSEDYTREEWQGIRGEEQRTAIQRLISACKLSNKVLVNVDKLRTIGLSDYHG